jgi:zinc transporter
MPGDAARVGPDDHAGLICAFELAPLAPRGVDVLEAPPQASPFWLHLNLSDTRATRWLAERSHLPAAAQTVLLGADPRVHSQPMGGGFACVLGDVHHDFRGDPESVGVLRLYVDAQRMVTARRHPLKSSDLLRRQLGAGTADASSPIQVFEQYVRCLAETFASEVAHLGDETDGLEDRILAGDYHAQGAALGRIRRTLVRLRRLLNADRSALAALLARPLEILTADALVRLRPAVERLDGVAQDLELVQERARLLQEEIAGRVGEETNRNLFWLSIVTTVLLPITLITGVFGMNVGGLPLLTHRHGFWWIMVMIIFAVTAILYFLRRRKVL